jgi:hypothetical protein
MSVPSPGIDATLGLVQKVTEGTIDFSQTITNVSLRIPETVLDATECVLDSTGFQKASYFRPGDYGAALAVAIANALRISSNNSQVMALLLSILVDREKLPVAELARGLATFAELQRFEQEELGPPVALACTLQDVLRQEEVCGQFVSETLRGGNLS